MRQRPVAAAAVTPAVPQEKGKKLLALSPKTVSRRLTGAHKIPDRLMSRIGRPDPYQFAGTVQTHQRNRIPTIRLDPLARAFRDQRRSNRQAVVPERLHLVIKPVSRRPGLKAANQRLWRAIMDENGGGAGGFVGASQRAIVLRLTSLRWFATPKSSPARAA